MNKTRQNGTHEKQNGSHRSPQHHTKRKSDWDSSLPVPTLSFYTSATVIFIVAVLCFVNSYNGDFVFDDSEAILSNNDLKPETPLSDLFVHDFWGNKLDSKTSHKSYRPLTVLTFRSSDVGTFLEARHRGMEVDGILLGDSGYACSRYLLTPYLRPVTESQQKYNDAHTRTRAVIERCFGWLKRRFMVLHEEIKCKTERVPNIVVACAVLHNIAIQHCEPMEDGECEVDSMGRQNIDQNEHIQPRNDNIRQYITNTFF